MNVTANVKTPESLYSLNDDEVISVVKRSTKEVLTKEEVTQMLEERFRGQRRVAKSIANRIEESDLSSLHRTIVSKVGSDVEVETVRFDRERKCATIVLK